MLLVLLLMLVLVWCCFCWTHAPTHGRRIKEQPLTKL